MIEREFLLELLGQLFDELYVLQVEEDFDFRESQKDAVKLFEETGIRSTVAKVNPDKRFLQGKLWGICYVMKWDFEQDGNVFRVFTQAKKKVIMEHKVEED